MNAAHVHLLFNHFPIVGAVICLLLMIGAYLFGKRDVAKAALLLTAFVALMAIPAFVSGEGAEETVEHMPGVNADAIHAHEEFGEISFWLMEATGLFALFTLYVNIRNHRLANALLGLTFALLVGTTGAMIQTGNLGGKIHHPELQQTKGTTPAGEQGQGDKDND